MDSETVYYTRSKALELKNKKNKKLKKNNESNDEQSSITNNNDTKDNNDSDTHKKTLPIKIVKINNNRLESNTNKKKDIDKKLIKDVEDKVKIKISNPAEKLLTNIVLQKFNNLIKNKKNSSKNETDSDSDTSSSSSTEESDSELDDLEGLPDTVIYNEEEEDFLKSMTEFNKQKFIKMENDLYDYDKTIVPHRFKIMETNLPISIKSNIIKKLDLYYSLEESDNEFHKLSQWIDSLNMIPFDNYIKPNVSISHPSNNIIKHLHSVKLKLDESIYGHEIAKTQIIQELARQITNPKSNGNSIAIQGPPGNGKTTLIKDGVCKATNRPFAFIPLGGMQNSEFLIGHDYTYEGAKCGRIVEILQESKCMNPIIYFDELDKLSDSNKGDEIANLLCHLTDFSQNNSFQDKYFSGINFDLSKATYIFSYNDESKINPILLDRLIKIHTKGFSNEDKLKIAHEYLIPKLATSFGFNNDDVIFNDDVITHIINTYTEKEQGVRNLKRSIETIYSKINVLRLLNGYSLYDPIVFQNKKLTELNNIKHEEKQQQLQKDKLLEKQNKKKDKEKEKEIKLITSTFNNLRDKSNNKKESLIKELTRRFNIYKNYSIKVLKYKKNDEIKNFMFDMLKEYVTEKDLQKEYDILIEKMLKKYSDEENDLKLNEENDPKSNEENDLKLNKENNLKSNEENDLKSNEENDLKSNEENEITKCIKNHIDSQKTDKVDNLDKPDNNKLDNHYSNISDPQNNLVMNLLDNIIDKVLDDLPITIEQKQKIVTYTFKEFEIPIKITNDLVDKFLIKDSNNSPPIGMYL